MSKLYTSDVNVLETNLYEVVGEDGMLVVYDCIVEAICDGDIYHHKLIYEGHVQDHDGFEHPNFNAKNDAEYLANRIREAGAIDIDHWELIGNLSEEDGSICYENFNMGV